MKRYIKSDSGFGKDFNVFMLMEYHADTGPDTMGMEGDTFDCLGVFYANSLESAKREFDEIIKAHPDFNFDGWYVDNYIEAFDPKDEDPYYGMPVVYPNLSALIDSMNLDEYYWRKDEEEDELPFDPASDKTFFDQCIDSGLDTIELDPDYKYEISDIRYFKNEPNATYDIAIYFEDGSELDYSFNMNDIIKCEDVSEGSKVVSDSLYAFLKASGR